MKNLVQIRLPKNALIQSDEDIEVIPPPEHGHDLVFTVFCNGIPIAQAQLERQHQPHASFAESVLMFTEHYMPTYQISAIEVDASHRNRGIGTVLLREVMHYCQNHRVKRLMAEVASDSNPKLQNWYLSHGFNFAGVDLLELTLN
jgi:ribosomal protein S18 acetylase RimI-like enzyme